MHIFLFYEYILLEYIFKGDMQKMRKIFLGVLIGITTSSFLVLCYLLYNFVVVLNLI